MKLTKAAPAPRAVTTIRNDFDRLFDQLASANIFGPPARIFETMWSPALDFSETENEYVVRLEAPGLPKEDLEINLEGQTLTISGRRDFEKEEKTEEYFWREREAGKFVRSVQLPSTVDASKVKATYENGIMTIQLPKTESSLKTRIQIK